MARGRNWRVTNYGNDRRERRVILLIDMDYFEVQVHQSEKDIGKPRVVVNRQDRILAVSPEAKLEPYNISRTETKWLRESDAQRKGVIRIVAPYWERSGRPKARKVLEATKKITNAITSYLHHTGNFISRPTFEYSSRDEFYVDLTYEIDQHQIRNFMDFLKYNPLDLDIHSKVKVYGMIRENVSMKTRLANLREDEQEGRLLLGGLIASKLANIIKKETNFQCSIGVGGNKLMAKLACGSHKPNGITVVTPTGFQDFSLNVKINDIPRLGGWQGKQIMERFQISNVAQLQRISFNEIYHVLNQSNMQQNTRKLANAFLNLAHGLSFHIVKNLRYNKKFSCKLSLRRNYETIDMLELLDQQLEEFEDTLDFHRVKNHIKPVRVKCFFGKGMTGIWTKISGTKFQNDQKERRQEFENAIHYYWGEKGYNWAVHIILTAWFPGASISNVDAHEN